jgi:hypothetical protein
VTISENPTLTCMLAKVVILVKWVANSTKLKSAPIVPGVLRAKTHEATGLTCLAKRAEPVRIDAILKTVP